MHKIILMMTGFLILAGCTKSPLDYRYKYIGDYSFIIHHQIFVKHEVIYDSAYSSEGKIEFSDDDHGIIITISHDLSYYAGLFEDRSLISRNFRRTLQGEFESSKKLHFSVYEYYLGSSETIEVTGEKIK